MAGVQQAAQACAAVFLGLQGCREGRLQRSPAVRVRGTAYAGWLQRCNCTVSQPWLVTGRQGCRSAAVLWLGDIKRQAVAKRACHRGCVVLLQLMMCSWCCGGFCKHVLHDSTTVNFEGRQLLVRALCTVLSVCKMAVAAKLMQCLRKDIS